MWPQLLLLYYFPSISLLDIINIKILTNADTVHLFQQNNSHGGSEHELYGQKRAFEVHFVHFNTKYPDSAEADMYPDGSIVLAVLFDWNNETADNPALAPITKKLRDVQDFKEEVLLEEDFNLRGLLPTDIATFYWYQGSLTTPPCSEEITWIVFPEVQEISYKQLKSFEFSLENEDNKVLGTTARQVKPLNNRTVKISSNKHCYDGLEEEQGENDNDGNNQDGQTLNINLSGARDTSKPIVIVLQQPVDDVDDNGQDDSSSTTSSTTTTTTTPEPTTTTTTTTTTPEPTTTTTTEEPSTTTSTSTTTTTTTTTEAPSTEEPEYDAEEVEELLMGGNDDGSNLREETDTNNNDGDLGSNDSQNGDENNGDEDEEQEEENGNEGGSNNDEVDESNNDGDGNDDQQDGKDGSGRQAQERNQEGDGGGSGQGDDGSDTVTISKETLNPMKEMFSGLFGRRKKRNSWNTRS